jgi:predicted AlkP superfamily phosphohydrolase/phosphomutase
VVNVPVTHPPEPFDGALVPGFFAPNAPRCHPEGLLEEVREAIDGYRVYPPRKGPSREIPIEGFQQVIRMRSAAFRYLADRFDPDFGFVEFQQTDTVFHKRPDDQQAIETVYSEVDSAVGDLLDACSPENVFLVSDHGMGRYEKYEFRVNEFLRDEEFVTATKGGRGMPTWTTIKEDRLEGGGVEGGWFEGDGVRSAGQELFERGVAAAARVGLTTQRIAIALETLGLAETVGRMVPHGVMQAGSEQVNSPRSRAYARTRSELGVRINLRGREPEGVVPNSEYDAVRSALADALESVRTPDGDPVFEEVAPREEYFEGPHVEDAADLVTVPANFEQLLSVQLGGETFEEPSEPWNHKRHGLLAARGPAIDAETGLDDAHLFDVTPTVLATFDVPKDVVMDGRTLPIVASAGEQRYPDYDSERTEPTDSRAIEERLADLGYLE